MCVRRCDRSSACLSIRYDRNQLLCELLGETSGGAEGTPAVLKNKSSVCNVSGNNWTYTVFILHIFATRSSHCKKDLSRIELENTVVNGGFVLKKVMKSAKELFIKCNCVFAL
jgi:hypothetical protein